VLTPTSQDEELESSTGSDTEMQDTYLTNESEESEGDDADRREMGLTERLARYHPACYVETPWCENKRALEMLTSWFGERTMEWVTDECIQAGIIMNASEAGAGKSPVLVASIPRRTHGPREQEFPLAPQASPPTMDVYRECAMAGLGNNPVQVLST
jgi:hypothetical protein